MSLNQDIKRYLACRKAILTEQSTIEFHQGPSPGLGDAP